MHEVKVYDSSGNLKKVISAKTLNTRAEKLIKSPMLFRRKGPISKSPPDLPNSAVAKK